MLTPDYRLQHVENELTSKGISARYLKINHRLALRVWQGNETFKQLLPEHKISDDYYIVDLDYACDTLVGRVNVA